MQLRFREKHGQSWQNGPDLVLVPDEQQARTSLFNLRPDTEYEIEVFGNDAGTERRFQQEFRTWSASPPIAKTVTLDAESFNGQLVISQSGKPDGWVKYTATPGTVLQGNQQADAVIQVRGANYIVLENLTIRGGEHYGIELVSTDQVRVVNCDIAGFGQKGEQRRDLDGKFYINAKAVNYDAGIFINGSSNLLIERCYIHDPKGTANPWFFSHPAGPTAIFVKAAGGTVIRYNDLIGSDSHRWNDVIEGFNNSSKNGGFRCDADVYGNFMAFGNDDGIEFDGGQMNCRFFENRVEGTLCGISLAPCLRGPSYILKNQFINPGDVAGARLYVIKNSKNLLPKGRLHVYSNTAAGKWGYGFSRYGGNGPAAGYEKELKGIVLNNLFGGDFGMSSDTRAAKHRFDYNLYTKNYPWGEAPMEGTNSIFSSPQWINSSRGDYRLAPSSPGTNKALTITGLNLPKDIGSGDNMPRRPTPFALDASELHFSKDSGAIHTVTVQGEGTFRIAQNEATTFFTVLPSSGKAPLKLQVKLGPDVENSGKRFLGAFAVRGEDGWSRTVSVYADFLDFLKTKPGILIDRFRGREQFEAVPGPVPGRKAIRFEGNNRTLNAEFEVPEAGAYYIFARVCGNGSVMLSLDDEPLRRCSFYTGSERWGYSGVAYIEGGGFYSGRPFRPLQLTRGKHSLRLIPHSNAVDFDAFYIVPVDNLDDFLPIFTEGR